MVLAVFVAWPILFVALAVMAYEDVLSWQLRAKRPGILDIAVPIVAVGAVFLAHYVFGT